MFGIPTLALLVAFLMVQICFCLLLLVLRSATFQFFIFLPVFLLVLFLIFRVQPIHLDARLSHRA